MEQQLKWDEVTNKIMLITQSQDGSILVEQLTSEQAAQWVAENRY